MSPELKRAIKQLLEEFVALDSQEDRYPFIYRFHGNVAGIERTALIYLETSGCVAEVSDGTYCITAAGRAYLDKLNTWGPWYWIKNNWFPFAVAVTTVLVSVGSLVANLLN